jgi:hypothetical protein
VPASRLLCRADCRLTLDQPAATPATPPEPEGVEVLKAHLAEPEKRADLERKSRRGRAWSCCSSPREPVVNSTTFEADNTSAPLASCVGRHDDDVAEPTPSPRSADRGCSASSQPSSPAAECRAVLDDPWPFPLTGDRREFEPPCWWRRRGRSRAASAAPARASLARDGVAIRWGRVPNNDQLYVRAGGSGASRSAGRAAIP